MTKKTAFLFAFASVAAAAFGERSLKAGIDAFNAAVLADTAGDVAFSPLSFDLDCCMLAEALDPIARANVSEKLSVMTDFAGAYNPVLDYFEDAVPSNKVEFLSARTIGVTELPKVNADFRTRVFGMRSNASVSLLWPTDGAKYWIRAKLDGRMEEFLMPDVKIGAETYSFVDAAFVGAKLPAGVSSVREEGNFRLQDGTLCKLPFCKFRVKVDFCRLADCAMMRIPLCDGAFLYVMVPHEGRSLADLRAKITGDAIRTLLLSPIDPDIKGSGSAVCDVSIPAIDIMAESDIEKGFGAIGIPESGIQYLYSTLARRQSFQTVRFLFDGAAADGAAAKPAPEAESKAVLNRPFVYFVHVPECNVIPVIGQFAGRK